MLHIFSSAVIKKLMDKKRKKYPEGWILEFPDGSPWRNTRREIKTIAASRAVKLGVIVLEALDEYVKKNHLKKNNEGEK